MKRGRGKCEAKRKRGKGARRDERRGMKWGIMNGSDGERTVGRRGEVGCGELQHESREWEKQREEGRDITRRGRELGRGKKRGTMRIDL